MMPNSPKASAAPKSDAYDVGYGKPPVGNRFVKGRSGNPRGSAKRTRRAPQDEAERLILEEAHRPVKVNVGGKTISMPAIVAIFRSQLAAGLKGDGPAQRAALKAVAAIEAKDSAKKAELLRVAIQYKEDSYAEIKRRKRRGVKDISDIDPHPDDVLINMEDGEVHFPKGLNTRDTRALRAAGIKR